MGIYDVPTNEGTLLSDLGSDTIETLAAFEYDTGVAVLVAGQRGAELLWRGVGETVWSRPWSADVLTPNDITGNPSQRFLDLVFRADGVLFGLLQEEGVGLSIVRTRGIFNPLETVWSDMWYATATDFPAVFQGAYADSQVGEDPLTRIHPKLRFDMGGSGYLVTANSILKVPSPFDDPDIWTLWLAVTGSGIEGDPVAGWLDENQHILDLAFDGQVPGVLARINPDVFPDDDGVLYVYGEDFREIAWQRRYPNTALRLCVSRASYPRSTVVHVGKTPSPLPGEGPDVEILGGEA